MGDLVQEKETPTLPKVTEISWVDTTTKKSYKSPSRRAAAIKRDMCHKGKSVVNDSRWAQNPRRHDLQGFDDGSQCDSPTEYKYRAPSAKQAAALARGRAKRASMRGGADGC